MQTAASIERQLERLWGTAPDEAGWVTTTDHKSIGMRYIATGFIFFVLGGLEALAMRTQLARPGLELMDGATYNGLFTMHGTTMIFLFATPILSGFGNYLVPLMIGARDMAFPRLNAFGYWIFVLAGIFMYLSFPASSVPQNGWFAYVPLSGAAHSPGTGMDFWTLGLVFLGIATTAGAINFIVTIAKLRAPGMSIDRMPLFVWNILVTAIAMLFAIPSLTVAAALLELDRYIGTHFYDGAAGGDPLLWQHLFWIFGHPDVYIIFMPAVGMVSSIVPVFARRTMVGYTALVVASIATIVISFGVWVHHMFAVGIAAQALGIFSAASMLIAIPAGLQMAAWIATIWAGRPVWSTAFLFVVGFLVLFLVGGLTGVMVASVPFDWQVTDSYFVVAHLHYVLFGGMVFPLFGAFYYWLPKMTGRLLDERLGVANFATMFVGFNLAFFPMHISGMLGMPRRVYTYPGGGALDLLNLLSTLGAYLIALSVVIFLANVAWSARRGALAGADPWSANTLEWATASPPPAYDFARIPVVRSRDPLWERGPLSAAPEPKELLTSRRETLGTSVVEAATETFLRLPGDSLAPALAAAAVLVLFAGLLLKFLIAVAIGVALVVATVAVWLWPSRETPRRHVPADRAARAIAPSRAPGWWGMALLVATDATMFALLLSSYLYLGSTASGAWPPQGSERPAIAMPILGTLLLLASSVPIAWAEAGIARGERRRLLYGLVIAALGGAGFLAVQVREYLQQTFAPQTDAYGSLFFTITSFHGAHVVVALLLVGVLVLRATKRHFDAERHLAVQNVALYWHFVGAVWVFIFATLYLAPGVMR
ncbi:MAG TPA: cytochrome c oxidase subunit I [Candidatus Limnocylindria bacterium]|nr:cytochrome c oxidase subunit I [Candidatus Limnocylindria bacterium]